MKLSRTQLRKLIKESFLDIDFKENTDESDQLKMIGQLSKILSVRSDDRARVKQVLFRKPEYRSVSSEFEKAYRNLLGSRIHQIYQRYQVAEAQLLELYRSSYQEATDLSPAIIEDAIRVDLKMLRKAIDKDLVKTNRRLHSKFQGAVEQIVSNYGKIVPFSNEWVRGTISIDFDNRVYSSESTARITGIDPQVIIEIGQDLEATGLSVDMRPDIEEGEEPNPAYDDQTSVKGENERAWIYQINLFFDMSDAYQSTPGKLSNLENMYLIGREGRHR